MKRQFNKLMKSVGITTSTLLIAITCQAHGFAQWGVASAHPGTKHFSDVKWAEFGSSGEKGRLAYTVGVGGWKDGTNYVGSSNIGGLQEKARDSFFFEALLGVEPKAEHFYLTYKLGPSIITHTDALLGSNVQMAHELGFGMYDKRNVRVGLVLKHFSNAGLVRPNLGRDFVGLRIEW